MKTEKKFNSMLAGLAVALILAGCATSGYKQADKTGEGIADFRDEIVKVKQAVDASLALFNRTAETAAMDPRKAFQTFAKSVDKAESARASAAKRGQAMKAAGDAYFKQWETQLAAIDNPEIRKLAEQRKIELNAIFGKLGPLLEQVNTRFDPFLSDLKDLRLFLSQDLTIAGVDAAKPIIKNTREHGDALQRTLDELIDEMNSIAAELTPAKVATK